MLRYSYIGWLIGCAISVAIGFSTTADAAYDAMIVGVFCICYWLATR